MASQDTENVSTWGSSNSAVPTVTAGSSVVSASTFQAMITVLNELANHNHTFYDDYTTVCDCQCQCDCTRGTL